MIITKPNLENKFSSSLTWILHFLENAQMQIDKMELEKKTNPRIIEAKRKSLLVIEKYIFDSKMYINSLETRENFELKEKNIFEEKKQNWRAKYDIKIPGQREAARYESIARTREKWHELF